MHRLGWWMAPVDGMRALVAFEYVLRIATKFDRLAGCSGLLCFAVPGAASSGGGSGVSCCWPAARACLAVLGAVSSGGGGGASCCWPAARACFALLCRGRKAASTTQITLPGPYLLPHSTTLHHSTTVATPPLLPHCHTHTHTSHALLLCSTSLPSSRRSSRHPVHHCHCHRCHCTSQPIPV